MSSGARFTKEQDDFLREVYSTRKTADIPKLFEEKFGIKRTVLSIFYRINKLGLKGKIRGEWTEDEINFLKENYSDKDTIEIQSMWKDKFGYERTLEAICAKAKKLKLNKCSRARWSEEEITYLEENFISKGATQLSKEWEKCFGYSRSVRSIWSYVKRHHELKLQTKELTKDLKEQIIKYIKLQHRKPDTWLKEHIFKKFGFIMNSNTVRQWKRKNNCLTNKRAWHKDVIKFLMKNYLKYSNKELAELIANKFHRPITESGVKQLKTKYRLIGRKQKVNKKGLTVKEIRICPNCGKEIKITCKCLKKKFCCKECAGQYHIKKTDERNKTVATSEKIKAFIKEWELFVRKIIQIYKDDLDIISCDEIYGDYLTQVPSIIYHLDRLRITKNYQIKGYLAGAIKNCILRKHKDKQAWRDYNVSFDLFYSL